MKNVLKRGVVAMLVTVMLLGATGCSSERTQEEDPTSNAASNEETITQETLRVYLPQQMISSTEGSDITQIVRWEYPDDWMNQEEFTVIVFVTDENGDEQIACEMHIGDHYFIDNRPTIQTRSTYGDDRKILSEEYVSSTVIRHENNTDYYTYTMYYKYNEQGIQIQRSTVYTATTGETITEVTDFVEVEEGRIFREYGPTEDWYYDSEYNDAGQLISYSLVWSGEELTRQEYIYDDKGILIGTDSYSWNTNINGQRENPVYSYTEIQYMVVDVPASIAEKFCFFATE